MRKAKIALVGPVFPYRGGIAQYNTQLHKQLTKISRLKTVSFDKLYPEFLYPGESNIEHGAESKKETGVDYVIHIYKPWSIFKTANQIKKSGAEVALINWWTLIWQPGLALLSQLLRWRGVRTVYICHNVYDHDGGGFKQKVSKLLLRLTDGYIVHSSGDAKVLKSYYKKPILNTKVLPVYSQFRKAAVKLKKRGRLELLFFGFVRPYKGLEDLVIALGMLNDKEIYLTVVGESWADPQEIKNKLAAINAPNIELHLEYVSDKQAAEYFSRSDALVLPYKKNTASAVAALAYNFKKPIIASNVEGLSDAVVNGETGWLFEANNPEALAETIAKIDRKKTASMKPKIEKFCAEHSWQSMAKQISDFAQKLTT